MSAPVLRVLHEQPPELLPRLLGEDASPGGEGDGLGGLVHHLQHGLHVCAGVVQQTAPRPPAQRQGAVGVQLIDSGKEPWNRKQWPMNKSGCYQYRDEW